MFRTIMVPLDGSEFAKGALATALEVARRSGGGLRLVLVHAGPPPVVPGEAPEALVEADREAMEREAEALRRTAGSVRAEGVEVSVATLEGPVVETLVEEAERKADLVVMATHGRGPFSRFWLGSVADGLARRASVPVLFLKPDREGASATPIEAPGRILVPLDGSRLSHAVLEPASDLARLYDATLLLLQVLPPAIVSGYSFAELPEGLDVEALEVLRGQAEKQLGSAAEALRREGFRVETRIEAEASVPATILRTARERADLVAMATHGRGGLRRLVLGSVTDKVLRASEKPLLLLRPSEEAVGPGGTPGRRGPARPGGSASGTARDG